LDKAKNMTPTENNPASSDDINKQGTTPEDPVNRFKSLLSASQDDGETKEKAQPKIEKPDEAIGWYGEGELPSAPLHTESTRVIINTPTPNSNSTPTTQLPEPELDSTIPPAATTQPSATLPLNRPPEVDLGGTRVLPVIKPLKPEKPVDKPIRTVKPISSYKPVSTEKPANSANPASRSETRAQTPKAERQRPSFQLPSFFQKKTGEKPSSPIIIKFSNRDADNPSSLKSSMGCLLRSAVFAVFFCAMMVLALASVTVFQYFSLVNSSNFPDVDNLKKYASQFETTKIYDRNGDLLYELIDPNAGRRTYVPIEKISPYVIAATIATEDQEYYNHPGFDPLAIGRALWQNYTSGEVVSGASTITQQLARTFLLSSSERNEKTVQRKAKEIVLAAEITRKYSKEEILELYLNENNYGNMAYGIEAAAETYFNTTSDKLTLSQAAFLAGIPQAPSVYDISANRDVTLQRQKQVLVLMYQTSKDKNCIDVSTNTVKVCVAPEDVITAAKDIETYHFSFPENQMQYPHWVNYIRSVLEQQFGSQNIYMSGFSVVTTLDNELQKKAEDIVKAQVDRLADKNVHGGALVAIEPSSGQILAMVGSPDFNNESASGQINMAVSPRQPGSSFKPLTYAAAFEKGWTPSTLIWDIPSQFPPSGKESDTSTPYAPVNYDGRFHGPVRVRDALANSYNIPAVKALQFVGIYDDPNTNEKDGLINFAKRMGITTLTRDDYGLSLTLGGGDVSLLELTSAYSTFANEGARATPVSILKIVNYKGETVYEYNQPDVHQVIRPQHAYLISSILSDKEARIPMFGSESVLNLPFTAAVKTGTTNDFRDNWTLGYTPDLAVGVWVGNPDYTPMQNTTGVTGAAPIWSEFMQYAIQKLKNGLPTTFRRPDGIEDKIICAVSGTEPSDWCPKQKSEIFVKDQPPLKKDSDLWQQIKVDTWTGLKSSPACSDYLDDKFVLGVTDKDAQKWILNTGEGRKWVESIGFKDDISFAPDRECSLSDARPNIYFSNPIEDQSVTSSPLDIFAIVNASANFSEFKIEWGRGHDPQEWKELAGGIKKVYEHPDQIYSWDVTQVPSGKITLRIYMKSKEEGRYAEKRVHLNIMVPTSTATIEPTETPEPTETLTFTPSVTPVPSETPVPTATSLPTETPVTPTSTHTEPATEIPSVAPSETPGGTATP
jgi:penicillin-binding protein 1C